MSKPLVSLVTDTEEGGYEEDRVLVGTKANGASFGNGDWSLDEPGVIAAINEAHAAVVEPLQALLSQARAEFVSIHGGRPPPAGQPGHRPDCPLCRVLDAIDAADPGEWVPKARLDEAHRIIADLREERRSPAQERIDRALEYVRDMSGGQSFWEKHGNQLTAILEGREVEPAKAEPEWARREYLGEWPDRPQTEPRDWRTLPPIVGDTDDDAGRR